MTRAAPQRAETPAQVLHRDHVVASNAGGGGPRREHTVIGKAASPLPSPRAAESDPKSTPVGVRARFSTTGAPDAQASSSSSSLTAPLDVQRGALRFADLKPAHLQAAAVRVAASSERNLAASAVSAAAGNVNLSEIIRPIFRARSDTEALRTVLEVLREGHPDPTLRKISEDIDARLPAFGLPSTKGLLESIVDSAAAATKKHGFDEDALRKLERSLRDAGFGLTDEETERLEALAVELVGLARQYRENIESDARDFGVTISDLNSLTRMPEELLSRGRIQARERGVSGCWFPIDGRHTTALLRFCDDASVRAEVSRRALRRGLFHQEDNIVLAERMIAARHELAELLGYARFSDYARRHRSLSPEEGLEALSVLSRTGRYPLPPSMTGSAFRSPDSASWASSLSAPPAMLETLAPMPDAAYLFQLELERVHGVSEQEIRAFFPAATVIDALLTTSTELFGITFERPTTPTKAWHEDVRVLDVMDADRTCLARIYLDLYARKGKPEGARTRCAVLGEDVGSSQPSRHVFLLADLPSEAPSLLGYDDVLGIAHEFGHLLHACLGAPNLMPLDAFLTSRDTLEFPARLFEKWWLDDRTLARFARHFKTGEVMPPQLRAAVIAREAELAVARRVEVGALAEADLYLHTVYRRDVDGDLGVVAGQIKARHATTLDPNAEGRGWIASAGHPHIFSSPIGYAGTYDAYLEAEAFAELAFAPIREVGPFDSRIGYALRSMLSALSQDGVRSVVPRFLELCRDLEPSSPDADPSNDGTGTGAEPSAGAGAESSASAGAKTRAQSSLKGRDPSRRGEAYGFGFEVSGPDGL